MPRTSTTRSPSQAETTAAYAGWKRGLVAMANANRARISSDFATVRAVVDAAPLVFGVFQDPAEPDGVGTLIVKGHALLREIVASGRAWPAEMTAVPCLCLEQAEALRRVAGESDRLH